ncbi:MAG: DUF4093 domain-containing protein [Negativicutes bacterium]|nr:DUF4093 domain-containing protein [Negativicutes bacterium]
MEICEVVVVEGKKDVARVKQAVAAECIATNGHAISPATWRRLTVAYRRCGLIIFTDPDWAGNRIRQRLNEQFPAARQAHLPQRQARTAGGIGIQYASAEDIRRALLGARCVAPPAGAEPEAPLYRYDDLVNWRLAATGQAEQRRRQLAERLSLAPGNAKFFLRQINKYRIDRRQIEAGLVSLAEN